MNENCKYCKNSKTCLENADYGSIYCQLHKKIPKVIGKTYDELQQENQKLKQQLEQRDNIINKAKEYVEAYTTKYNIGEELYIDEFNIFASPNKLSEILNIDKGDE